MLLIVNIGDLLLTVNGVIMSEKFLSTRDISEILGISMNRVRQKIRNGELPGLHDGYTYLIPESELLRWMDAHKIRRQT